MTFVRSLEDMKLIVCLVWLLLVCGSIAEAKKILKCGRIESKCVPAKKDGTCPTVPFCPSGFKRKLSENGCCCFLRDSFIVKNGKIEIFANFLKFKNNFLVNHQNVNAAKKKIFTEAFDVIERNYKDALRHRKIAAIDVFGQSISYAMKSAINELANLVDIEFESLLRHIFDDEFNNYDEYRMSLVEKEAKEIFELGNAALDGIAKQIAKIYTKVQ